MSGVTSRSGAFTEDEEAVVRSLSRLMYALPRAIDADMVREQRLPFSEFLVLMRLSEAPGQQLRMNELAGASEMSLSGMSRVVTRLESQGFVKRNKCEEDARGWFAVLTDSGRDRLADAWPSNLAAVRRHFLNHLSGFDLKKLAEALQNVAT